MEANLITHGSKFHADDVFSTAFMSLIIENPVVCRVNNIDFSVGDDVIIYDIGFGEFDHHQKSRNGQRDNGIKYASAGLIWKKYGLIYQIIH